MSAPTISFTRATKGDTFKLFGIVLLCLIFGYLAILFAIGGLYYLPFPSLIPVFLTPFLTPVLGIVTATVFAKWMIEGFEFDGKKVTLSMPSKKELPYFVLLYLSPILLALLISPISAIVMFLIDKSSDYDSEMILQTIWLVLLVFTVTTWVISFYTHFYLSLATVHGKRITIEGTPWEFAGETVRFNLLRLPLHFLTLGIYSLWFVPKSLRLWISKIEIDGHRLQLNEGYTAGTVLYNSFTMSFYSALTLGIGAPYFALKQLKELVELYIDCEAEETTLEVLEEKSNSPVVEYLKVLRLPLAVALILWGVVGVNLGYKTFQYNKRQEEARIAKETREREEEKKRKEEKEIQEREDTRRSKLKDRLSTIHVAGMRNDTSFMVFGSETARDFTIYYKSDSLFWSNGTESKGGRITGIQPKSDTSGTVEVRRGTMKYRMRYSVTDNRYMDVEELFEGSEPLTFVSEDSDVTYSKRSLEDQWVQALETHELIKGSACRFSPWKKQPLLNSETLPENSDIKYYRRVEKEGKEYLIFSVIYSEPESQHPYNSALFEQCEGRNYHISSNFTDRAIRFSVENDTVIFTNSGTFSYAIGSRRKPVSFNKEEKPYVPYTTELSSDKSTSVTIRDTKLWITEVESGKSDTIINDPYGGDWSFGEIVWSPSGNRFYFDNSGACACIWQYDLTSETLTKIVPEHTAEFPQVYEENGDDVVLFLDRGVLYRAEERGSEELSNLVKEAWLTFDESQSACSDFDYYPNGGVRTYFCHLLKYLSVGSLKRIAGMSPFLSGPHSDDSFDFHNSTDFGRYNPEFIEWASNNLFIGEDNRMLTSLLRDLYKRQFSRVVEHLLAVNDKLSTVPEEFGHEVERYRTALENGDAKELNYTLFSRNMVNSGAVSKSYNWHDPEGYISDSSIAFWVRRSVDGTFEEVEALLRKFQRLYN